MIKARRRFSHAGTLPYQRLLKILVQSVPLRAGRLATQSQISKHPLKQCGRDAVRQPPTG